MIHELKLAPRYFDAVADGSKPFEVRFNDRNYKVGDVLLLKEYVEEQGHYTGRKLSRLVTFVLNDKNFCKEDLVILGLRPDTREIDAAFEKLTVFQRDAAWRESERRKVLLDEAIEMCAVGDITEETDDGIGWGSWVGRAKAEVAKR